MDCYFAAVKKRLQSFELSAALPLPYNYPSRHHAPPGFLVSYFLIVALLPCRYYVHTCRYYRGLSPLPSAVIPQTIKNRLTRYSVLKSSQTKFLTYPSFPLSLPSPTPPHLSFPPRTTPALSCSLISVSYCFPLYSLFSLSSTTYFLSSYNPLDSKQLTIRNNFVAIKQQLSKQQSKNQNIAKQITQKATKKFVKNLSNFLSLSQN